MTDTEIKNFIDSREALTQRELSLFIFGDSRSLTCSAELTKWWGYVIDTKGLVKINEHRKQKITRGGEELFNLVKEKYNNDIRLRELGYKSGCKLLKKLYGINIGAETYRTYRKCINSQQTV